MQEEGGLTRMRRSLGEVVHRDQRDMAGKVGKVVGMAGKVDK